MSAEHNAPAAAAEPRVLGYRALVGIDYPRSQDLQRVLAAGGLKALELTNPELHAEILARRTRREPGERCDDVPEFSRDWMLEQGLIEAIVEDVTADAPAVEPEG